MKRFFSEESFQKDIEWYASQILIKHLQIFYSVNTVKPVLSGHSK